MRRQQFINQRPNLVEGQFGCRVRVEHGGVVDMLAFTAYQRLHRQLLNINIGLHQRCELRRQRADFLWAQPFAVNQTGHFNTGIFGQIVDKALLATLP